MGPRMWEDLSCRAMFGMLLVAPASWAQSVPSASESDSPLIEIVVTAQKRAEGINRVPLTVQAFSGDYLNQAGVSDASQLVQLTPGLNFARSGSNTPILTLRGVGFNTPNLSSTSPVGVYADEVAYAYPYMANGPIFDLERVEVLKGPQGTLYGRNTTGGLINLIAAKPTDVLSGGASAELGNHETRNLEGFISGPIGDQWGFRLAGRWEKSDEGWQQSVTRDDRLGKKDKLGLRGILSGQPTEDLELDVIANYWRDQSDTIAGQAVRLIPNTSGFVQPGVAESVRTDWGAGRADWDPSGVAPDPLEVDSDFFSISSKLSWALSDHISVISLTAYNDLQRRDANDVDGTPIQVFSYTADGEVKSFSEELRLAGEYDRLNFILGGYYAHDKIKDYQYGSYDKTSVLAFLRFLSQNIIDPTNALYTPEQYADGFRVFSLNLDQTGRSASIFGNASYDATSKLKLTAGARYTRDKLEAFGCSRDLNGNTLPVWNTAVRGAIFVTTGRFPPNPVVPNGCLSYKDDYSDTVDPNRPSLEESNVAGRLSAQYQTDGGDLFYATVSRGFKSGAFPLIPSNTERQLLPAKQERVMAYEVGAKTTFARQLTLNAATFYYDYTDKQLFSEVPDIVFTTLTRIVNIPRSRVYGAEVEFAWQSPIGLQPRLGASYTDSKVREYDGFARSGQPLDFRGARFSNTPEWQLSGALSYDGDVSALLGVRGNINFNYQSSTSSSLIGEAGYEIDAYTTVNASVALYSAQRGWEVGAFAKNLFNENYWTSANYYADVVYRVPGQTRTFGLTLGYRF